MVNLPFPCFQTNCKFNGGMSGGPIFCETGGVCGVICSTLPSLENKDEVSFASTLRPALGIKIDVMDNGQPTRMSVWELAKKGVIKTDKSLSQLSMEIEKNGKHKILILN